MDAMKRRKAKIVLAAVAVLGIGAVATSAVWSDQVFFQGDVTVGSFNIQGGIGTAPATWLESEDYTSPDVSTIELVFADLGPLVAGQTATWTGAIRNAPAPGSTVNADITAITADTSLIVDPLLSALTVTVAYDVPANAASVAPGVAVPFTVTVTLDDDAPTTVMGTSGTIVIQVIGTPVTV